MPKKKAQPLPLTGCNIALSGTFSAGSHGVIQAQLAGLGAGIAGTIAEDTTHLVTVTRDYEKPSVKVRVALENNLHIISYEWVKECLASNSKVPEANYLFTSLVVDVPSQSNGVLKREPSPDISADENVEPQTKKQKNSNGSKAVGKTDVKGKTNVKAKTAGKADVKVNTEAKVKAEVNSETKAKSGRITDGQVAKSLDVKIPLDEGCNPGCDVYIRDDGLIYDVSLNQANATANNNKFYRIQVQRDCYNKDFFMTWTRWGRVGERGQSASLGTGHLEDAIRHFEKKFKEKSGLAWADRRKDPKPGKYAFIERNYTSDSDDSDDDEAKANGVKNEPQDELMIPESTLHPATQQLMGLIFNQQYFDATMSDLNYDANKLPLGKLSKATISRGFQTLKDLGALLDDPSLAASYDMNYDDATEHFSNLYYTVIPHAFGRNRPPIIRSTELLKKEIELLESLGDMKDAALIMKPKDRDAEQINLLDRQFQGLGIQEMTPLGPKSSEFGELKNYLLRTQGATHNLNFKVEHIFRIEREGEKQRFEEGDFASIAGDRRLLWHGSRCTNFAGILSQGLRIAPPEAPVSGYMFGKGIYLADMSSKSANYCCPYISNGHALLLLCEAELGKPMQTLTDASYSASEDATSKGLLSTWGQGSTGPKMWKDANCVNPSLEGVLMPDTTMAPGPTDVENAYLMYNEYICYDVAQVRLRYLFQIKM
ncbi:hypothetical protein V493_05637 [Pseudogymnoascus sp. VKM F-4281 (FW-2241)]|nr:hypothetical protein V493_05637 [Pseudogymnoascus sp. VKM F-4281 (FW-2241)]